MRFSYGGFVFIFLSLREVSVESRRRLRLLLLLRSYLKKSNEICITNKFSDSGHLPNPVRCFLELDFYDFV